jgi:hypothetical protein
MLYLGGAPCPQSSMWQPWTGITGWRSTARSLQTLSAPLCLVLATLMGTGCLILSWALRTRGFLGVVEFTSSWATRLGGALGALQVDGLIAQRVARRLRGGYFLVMSAIRARPGYTRRKLGQTRATRASLAGWGLTGQRLVRDRGGTAKLARMVRGRLRKGRPASRIVTCVGQESGRP